LKHDTLVSEYKTSLNKSQELRKLFVVLNLLTINIISNVYLSRDRTINLDRKKKRDITINCLLSKCL